MHTTLLMPGAYARRPLCDRFQGMDWARGPSGVAFVYGDTNDWMERSAAEAVRDGVHGMKQRVAVCRVAGAGLSPNPNPNPDPNSNVIPKPGQVRATTCRSTILWGSSTPSSPARPCASSMAECLVRRRCARTPRGRRRCRGIYRGADHWQWAPRAGVGPVSPSGISPATLRDMHPT